jgi:TonB family protein
MKTVKTSATIAGLAISALCCYNAQAIERCGDDLVSGQYSKEERVQLRSWLDNFTDKIEKQAVYREISQELLEQLGAGKECWYYFGLSKNGEASGVTVLGSSGSEKLDASIVELFQAASPFEPPPNDTKYRLIAYFKIDAAGKLQLISRLDKFVVNPDLLR